MPKYRDRWPTYAKQWDEMQRTRLSMANDAAERILSHKSRYQVVEAKTGVPWWWIGATHYREADLDFGTQLAQGDPLGKVSVNVPRGQGPYFGEDAWERAAVVALEDHHLNKVIDWRVEKALYWWESYNGWGYFNHGCPSAYVWAGTNQYSGGMYVRDGVWSETAQDRRVGTAPILKCLQEMDPSILLVRETYDDSRPMPPAPQLPKPEPKPVPAPAPTPVDTEALARIVMALIDDLNKQKQTPSFQALYKALLAWLPSLGVYGVIASIILNAFGMLGSAPMLGAENATAVTAFTGSIGAILSQFFTKRQA